MQDNSPLQTWFIRRLTNAMDDSPVHLCGQLLRPHQLTDAALTGSSITHHGRLQQSLDPHRVLKTSKDRQ